MGRGTNKYSSFTIDQITESALQPLQTAAENFFIKNGFTIDNLNKLKNPLGDYYGYTLGDIKCLVTLSPHTDPFGEFFCGTIDSQEFAWRNELTPQLNPIFNPTNDPNITISVDKVIGNYATGGAGGLGGGAAWYAVKVNGQWKYIGGQNSISCKLVKQYNIPKEIYASGGECSNNY